MFYLLNLVMTYLSSFLSKRSSLWLLLRRKRTAPIGYILDKIKATVFQSFRQWTQSDNPQQCNLYKLNAQLQNCKTIPRGPVYIADCSWKVNATKSWCECCYKNGHLVYLVRTKYEPIKATIVNTQSHQCIQLLYILVY